MNCPNCGEQLLNDEWGEYIPENIVQYYPEILFECRCGSIVDEKGEDKTEEYYSSIYD